MSAAQGEAMPIHRWTRVTARAFHDFHQTWLVEIKRALNGGILPPGFYALAERIAGGLGPKVLTLAGPVLDFIWRGIPQLIGGCSVLLLALQRLSSRVVAALEGSGVKHCG